MPFQYLVEQYFLPGGIVLLNSGEVALDGGLDAFLVLRTLSQHCLLAHCVLVPGASFSVTLGALLRQRLSLPSVYLQCLRPFM